MSIFFGTRVSTIAPVTKPETKPTTPKTPTEPSSPAEPQSPPFTPATKPPQIAPCPKIPDKLPPGGCFA